MSKYIESQFAGTKRMFTEYLQVEGNLSYDEWDMKPVDQKAALLFVNFYDQITLAWYKVRGEHTYEEEGVSEALAMCNFLCGLSVKKGTICPVKINPTTYKASYIYNVMRNAFSSLNYERKSTRSVYQHPNDKITVCSQYATTSNGDELDIFASYASEFDPLAEIENEQFWKLIENQDDTTLDVIEHLLNGKPIEDEYVLDSYGDIKCNKKGEPIIRKGLTAKQQKIVAELRVKLVAFYR